MKQRFSVNVEFVTTGRGSTPRSAAYRGIVDKILAHVIALSMDRDALGSFVLGLLTDLPGDSVNPGWIGSCSARLDKDSDIEIKVTLTALPHDTVAESNTQA